MALPLISVIIPCYNSAQYVSYAVDALLCQTYKNLEILIIDDNSTDDLQSAIGCYLKKYDFIKYAKLPWDDAYRFSAEGKNVNAGWAARNYGVELSTGDLITFQDADDGSCSNRIEFQYRMMEKYKSHHVNVDWQQYQDEYNGRYLDYNIKTDDIIKANEILRLVKKIKRGFFQKPFSKNENHNSVIRFIRRINRKLIGECESYPGAASMPLLKREVFEKCKFRPLWERTRPSLRGRGADQDFNYWVVETFRDSIVLKVPLVLWRVRKQNKNYLDFKYRPS